jgi:hypothetical protein
MSVIILTIIQFLKFKIKQLNPWLSEYFIADRKNKARKVFGELVEYGKVWRLGANEATEIEFYKDVKVGGKKVPKGRYTLYAIVNENCMDDDT